MSPRLSKIPASISLKASKIRDFVDALSLALIACPYRAMFYEMIQRTIEYAPCSVNSLGIRGIQGRKFVRPQSADA